jgi:hypothetical protein
MRSEIGVFDRESQTYVVTRIPGPPRGTMYLERRIMTREHVACAEIRLDCPKCFEPVRIHFEETATDHAMEMIGGRLGIAVAAQESQRADRAALDAQRAWAAAEEAERRFRRIQVVQSTRRKRKERKRRAS